MPRLAIPQPKGHTVTVEPVECRSLAGKPYRAWRVLVDGGLSAEYVGQERAEYYALGVSVGLTRAQTDDDGMSA